MAARPNPPKPSRDRLLPEAITAFVKAHPRWRFADGSLTCSIQFKAYMDGIAFVNRVAELAEAANHHPDLVVTWRKVDITLTTHDAGGVTQLDIDLAGRIEEFIGAAR